MRNSKKIEEFSQLTLAPWEKRNSTICKLPDPLAKWIGVTKYDLKFQKEMNYSRKVRNESEWGDIFENMKKYIIKRWKMSECNKFHRREMRNRKRIEGISQLIFAPWEIRNSTIWKSADLQAKWRGVVKYDWKFQIAKKLIRMRGDK
jgi:hypothetical protein